MSDTAQGDTEATAEAEREAETEAEAETSVEEETESTADEAVIDMEAAAEQEDTVEALRQRIQEQRDQIDALEDQMLDLSTRVADDGGIGVCVDCNGPVTKKRRLVRRNTIECTECGRVYHKY